MGKHPTPQQQQQQQTQKIGTGHFQAWGRAGMKELGQIVSAFPESVQPVEEYGLFGNMLPQEIHEQKSLEGLEMGREM